MRTIRWLIAHTPEYLFVRTAEKFREELNKLLPGEFDVEIYTTDQYIEKFNKFPELKLRREGVAGLEAKIDNAPVVEGEKSNPKWKVYFDALRDSEFEISQTQVTIIGRELDRNFTTLDLPFLFEDHDHVSRVLDDKIGDALCVTLAKKSNIRGLGFTYSGGYRVMGSTDPINSIEDMKKTKVLSSTITGDNLFKELGAETLRKVSADLTDFVSSDVGKSVETTYLRFNGKYILKTNHSIFMTTILTGEKFWNTLTPKQQEAFKIAAKEVAKAERQWSIEDAEKYEQEAVDKGIQIAKLTNNDKDVLRKAAANTYDSKLQYLNQDLIKLINLTKH